MGDVPPSHRITGTKFEIRLVEGIFDYFSYYSLLKDQDKPVMVSKLGSYLTPEKVPYYIRRRNADDHACSRD